MSVFLSHRTKDNDLARAIYQRLTRFHGIECYIDDFDDEAQLASSKEITTIIMSRLDSCSHLLALVTDNTKGSWWVPFEIGVARRAPRYITTFIGHYSEKLPSYLKEWPVLKKNSDIDIYAKLYLETKTRNKILFEKTASFNDQIQRTDNFHNRLKLQLIDFS